MKTRALFHRTRLALPAWILLGAFAMSSVQRFAVHPSGGHTHRQSDTIGMSIAFAEDLRHRGLSALDFIAKPKVITKALSDGINASEFPLLNYVTGPFYLIGRPWIGVFLSSLLILLLNAWAAYFYLPRHLRFWGARIDGVAGLLLWFSSASLATQSSVIMPEGFAFPLVLIGMTLVLEPASSRAKWVLGVVLCGSGIAVKPTLVVALGALPLLALIGSSSNHSPGEGRMASRLGLLVAMVASLVLPAYWYIIHVKHLIESSPGPQVFLQARFDPIGALAGLGPSGMLMLFKREPYEGQFGMFVGWAWIVIALFVGEWLPVLLYFVALGVAMALAGPHAYVHGYYLVGASLFSMLVMARILARTALDLPWLKGVAVSLLFWGVLFNTRVNVWVWARDSRYWRVNHWETGAMARAIIPESHHLVTDDGYPQKLLFIGRSGMAAGSSALQACGWEGYRTLPLAIVTDREPVRAGLCPGRRTRVLPVDGALERWYVVLSDPPG